MLKPHIAYCLVLTALTAAPVMAQTKSDAEEGGIQFITEQSPDQWRGSKLIGINVVGPNEEKIGAISELLVDHSGNAQAAADRRRWLPRHRAEGCRHPLQDPEVGLT
jgi:hypothetical protein